MDPEQKRHRLDAMEQNIEWLREHDLREQSEEAAKRLGLVRGDANALLQEISR